MKDKLTTPLYWDCECEEDYIHPKTESKCPVCGHFAEEQPDSRKVEVLAMLSDQLAERLIDEDLSRTCEFCSKSKWGIEHHDKGCVYDLAYTIKAVQYEGDKNE